MIKNQCDQKMNTKCLFDLTVINAAVSMVFHIILLNSAANLSNEFIAVQLWVSGDLVMVILLIVAESMNQFAY